MGIELRNTVLQPTISPFIWPALPIVEPLSEFSFTDKIQKAFDFEGHSISLFLSHAVPSPQADQHLGVQVGEENGTITYDQETLSALLGLLGHDITDTNGLPSEAHAIVIEHFLTLFLDPIADALGCPIILCATQSAGQGSIELQVRIDKNATHSIWLDLPVPVLKRIVTLFDQPAARMPTALPCDVAVQMPVALFGPTIDLDEDAFIELAVGDGIVFPHSRGQQLAQYLVLNKNPLAAVDVSRNRYTIGQRTNNLGKRRSQQMASSGIDGDVDDMTVEIHVELCSKMMKLGDIRQLKAGAVLPFDVNVPKNVRLFIGASCFAHGELVQLDESIAVRLTSFKE